MSKKIQTIIDLTTRARKRVQANWKHSNKTATSVAQGVATLNRREIIRNWGGNSFKGDMQQVYRVEIDETGFGACTYRLYHYETETVNVLVEPNGAYEFYNLYGESVSDRDSVVTFLEYVTGACFRASFKPSRDEFTVWDSGENILYQTDKINVRETNNFIKLGKKIPYEVGETVNFCAENFEALSEFDGQNVTILSLSMENYENDAIQYMVQTDKNIVFVASEYELSPVTVAKMGA